MTLPAADRVSAQQSQPAASATVVRQPLLTTEEAAAYLNVPTRWIADAARARKVRCTRIGKHIRFRIEHLDELIAAGEEPVSAPDGPLALVLPPRRRGGRSRL